MILANLVFVFKQGSEAQVLLGYKKRGFGQGKLDGFGGKPQAGESMAAAASRELHEECGLEVAPANLLPRGVITFVFPARPEWDHEVHLFSAQEWSGEPFESEEMQPRWFNLSEIPFSQMWDDSHYWMPHLLKGETIRAWFSFQADNETVKEYTIQCD